MVKLRKTQKSLTDTVNEQLEDAIPAPRRRGKKKTVRIDEADTIIEPGNITTSLQGAADDGVSPHVPQASREVPPSNSPPVISIPMEADVNPFSAPDSVGVPIGTPPRTRMPASQVMTDIETPIQQQLAALDSPGTTGRKTPRKKTPRTPRTPRTLRRKTSSTTTPQTEQQLLHSSAKKKKHPQKVKSAVDVWTFFDQDAPSQRKCKLCQKRSAATPDFPITVYNDTTSTGVLRHHLFTHHFDDWVAECDTRNIEITSKDRKLRLLLEDYRADEKRRSQGQLASLKYRDFTPEAFVDALADWIISDDQSLNVIDNRYLRNIFLMLRKDLHDNDIPHRTKLRTHIMKMWVDHIESIRAEVQTFVGKPSFTTDMWTDPNSVPYMAITMHSVGAELKTTPTGPQYVLRYLSYLIGFSRVPGRHSGEHLAAAFLRALDRFHVRTVGWLTMDNAFNNDTLAQSLENRLDARGISFSGIERRIRCFPHIVNIACQAVLKAITDVEFAKEAAADYTPSPGRRVDLIALLRTVIRLIRSSPQRRQIFAAELNTQGLKQLELLRDVETRWSSTCLMIERALALKRAINSFIAQVSAFRTYKISEDAWSMLESYHKILQVPHAFQQKLSAEKTPTLSYAIPSFRAMVMVWKKYQLQMPAYSSVIQKGIDKIVEYEEYTSEVPAYTLAILLNPSKKLRWFEINAPEDVEAARKTFIEHLQPYYNRANTPASPSNIPANNSEWADVLLDDNMDVHDTSDTRSLEAEVNTYFLDSQPCTDMVTFWQENQLRFPTAFQLALDILPIQGSAVPCERVFSSAKETKTARRNRIKPDLMEALQMLKFTKKGNVLSFTAGTDKLSELRMMEDSAIDSYICPEDVQSFSTTLQAFPSTIDNVDNPEYPDSDVHSARPISSVKKESNLPTVPNKFIVEVEDLSDIQKRSFARPHDYLYNTLKQRDVAFDVDKEYDASGLFVGAALTLNNANDAETLLNTPGVKAIRPVRKFDRPKPVKKQVVSGKDDAAVPPDSESTHVLTGVDRLHAEGITGKGVNIGILDTGIDYTHPALGGGFGPGHKVVGGFDFVGDAYTGSNTPVPDPDPLDQCEGHGTHVAGIIGADPNNPFDISGVAYDASISAYRIFGCEGSVTDDIIVEALLRGVSDKQDILTLSLGGADGWTESSSNVVASRIARSGKIVTIAAGNDGSSGSWYTSSPGNGIDVISVASLDNTDISLQNATVGGVQHNPITYFATFPFPDAGPFPIYATSNDTTIADDACNALPDNTPDLSSFVTVIRRGTCTFVQKLNNVAAKGAKIVLIYDNGNGFAAISVGTFEAALIQSFDGEFLVSQYAAGKNITISFPQSGGSTNFPDPNGGLISSFTSYGPSNDMFFKPAVAAPGGNILSTLPVPIGSYGVLSGTSMATPFVAGSAALLLEVKGKSASVATNARTLFETTAQTISSSHTDGDPLQTVSQQGAGLINVYDAIHTTTIVSPGELILNDTAHYKSIQTFTVKNTGKTIKKYTLSHVPAGTALTVDAGTIFPALGPVPLDTSSASVSIVPKSFTLLPGTTLPVVAIITPPKNVDKSRYPVFSGFINIVSGNDRTHVTYLGLAASLKDKQVVDNTDAFFGVNLPVVLDANGGVQDSPTNYTFVGEDFPTVLFRLAFGTPLLRIDLVDPNIKVTTTLNTREIDERGFPWFSFPTPIKGGTFSKVKILGPISELDYITRNNEDDETGFNTIALQTPTFANGTSIPNGAYRFLLRALKVTGDRTKQEDYETWLSPIVGVQSA